MEDRKSKKLLVLSQCFYPSRNRGGSTVSAINLVKAISNDFDTSVITTFYEMGTGKPYNEVQSGKNRIFGSDVYYLKQHNLWTVFQQIKKVKPSIIFVSSIFSIVHSIPAMLYKKYVDPNVRLIISPRGELMKSALQLKSSKKKVFIKAIKLSGLIKNVEFHVTSLEEDRELRKIFPGSSTHCIKDISLIDTDRIDRPKKECGMIRIFTAGRFHPIKNLEKSIEIAGNVKGNVQFDIYGPKEDTVYFDVCMKKAKELGGKATIEYKGNVEHDKIPELIANYHLFLSPTRNENFGHSIIEALQYGCPVIISNRTPWRQLEKFKAGYDIALEHEDEFITAIQRFIDMDDAEYQKWCLRAKQYSKEAMDTQKNNEEYRKLFLGQR
ncbi:MAG TPA: glycosyltransferase [Mobilitalea sp.]|nr:glycosyltransferase [Mobilitalea sp.]